MPERMGPSLPPAHSVKYEDEKGKRYFRIDLSGMSLSWRVILIIFGTIFGGGGTLAGVHFATSEEVDYKIADSIKAVVTSENTRHKKLDKTVNKHTKQIGAITGKIDSIQTVQHMDIAVREARRVTAHIKASERRQRELERIRRINMLRLANKGEVCSTIDCTN